MRIAYLGIPDPWIQDRLFKAEPVAREGAILFAARSRFAETHRVFR